MSEQDEAVTSTTGFVADRLLARNRATERAQHTSEDEEVEQEDEEEEDVDIYEPPSVPTMTVEQRASFESMVLGLTEATIRTMDEQMTNRDRKKRWVSRIKTVGIIVLVLFTVYGQLTKSTHDGTSGRGDVAKALLEVLMSPETDLYVVMERAMNALRKTTSPVVISRENENANTLQDGINEDVSAQNNVV